MLIWYEIHFMLVFLQSYFSLTQQIMEGLRIEEHADKYTHDCSGGTKRKLSYGMAMLGTISFT